VQRESGPGNVDIWLLDLARSSASRFTFDPSLDNSPLWSPDGSRIVFSSNREGNFNLYLKASNGLGSEELVLKSGQHKHPSDWSADGRFIVYDNFNPRTGSDLFVLPGREASPRDRKPFPFLQTQFQENHGVFSPDGNWMAYQSDESGRWEVYVQEFPGPGRAEAEAPTAAGGKWQISTAGGGYPTWRRDGKELFFIAPDRMLIAVAVKLRAANGRPTFEAGVPETLFDTGVPSAGSYVGAFPYATADGQRFLINTAAGEQPPRSLTVAVNWTAWLKR
jgi:Tol biopolymer transport system component